MGNLSQDIVHLSLLTVPHQIFGEITEIERYLAWGNESWDGILGLAPSGETGMLENMMTQNLLDRNMFSLKLPRGKGDGGEMLFGDVDHDQYIGELRSLPVLDNKKRTWAVDATSLSINDGEGLVLSLGGGKATFETEFPFIGLPEKYVRILDEALGMVNAGKSWENIRSVDCSERKMLHNISISLGREEFVISPWEYTIETDMGDLGGGRRCASAFVPNEDGGKDVVLGSAFLRAFYEVFDMDRKTVSCKYPLPALNCKTLTRRLVARATSQKIKKTKVEWEEELKRRWMRSTKSRP
jgi:hypothetical protein